MASASSDDEDEADDKDGDDEASKCAHSSDGALIEAGSANAHDDVAFTVALLASSGEPVGHTKHANALAAADVLGVSAAPTDPAAAAYAARFTAVALARHTHPPSASA